MPTGEHSRNMRYIMGQLYLYDDNLDEWVRVTPGTVGDMKLSLRTEDHHGWMKCDGRELEVSEYPELFEMIGYQFGGEENIFQLPDARGRVIASVGWSDAWDGTEHENGEQKGSPVHQLTVNQLPSHSHTITDPGHNHTINDPGHNHTVGNTNLVNGQNTAPGMDGDDPGGLDELNLTQSQTTTSSTNTTGITINNRVTGITVNSTGGGQPFNIVQPTLFMGSVFILAQCCAAN